MSDTAPSPRYLGILFHFPKPAFRDASRSNFLRVAAIMRFFAVCSVEMNSKTLVR